VPAADLQAAGLAPGGFAQMEVKPGAAEGATRAIRAVAPEPLVAMSRPPGVPRGAELVMVDGEQPLIPDDTSALAGLHMPSPSVAPFVLAIGFCLVFLGLITNIIILVTGLLWMLAGAIVWIRIGLLEQRAGEGHASEGEHSA
jgi:hypothetical protein